jgi:hypothetical protein
MNHSWLHYPIRPEDISRLWSLKRPPLHWSQYFLTVLLIYFLPFLSLAIEWAITWRHQLRMAAYVGTAQLMNPVFWMMMAIPATITFLIFLPLLRYPVRRWMVAIIVCLAWMVFLLSGEASVK